MNLIPASVSLPQMYHLVSNSVSLGMSLDKFVKLYSSSMLSVFIALSKLPVFVCHLHFLSSMKHLYKIVCPAVKNIITLILVIHSFFFLHYIMVILKSHLLYHFFSFTFSNHFQSSKNKRLLFL